MKINNEKVEDFGILFDDVDLIEINKIKFFEFICKNCDVFVKDMIELG